MGCCFSTDASSLEREVSPSIIDIKNVHDIESYLEKVSFDAVDIDLLYEKVLSLQPTPQEVVGFSFAKKRGQTPIIGGDISSKGDTAKVHRRMSKKAEHTINQVLYEHLQHPYQGKLDGIWKIFNLMVFLRCPVCINDVSTMAKFESIIRKYAYTYNPHLHSLASLQQIHEFVDKTCTKKIDCQ